MDISTRVLIFSPDKYPLPHLRYAICRITGISCPKLIDEFNPSDYRMAFAFSPILYPQFRVPRNEYPNELGSVFSTAGFIVSVSPNSRELPRLPFCSSLSLTLARPSPPITGRFNLPSGVGLQFPVGTFPTSPHKAIAYLACVGGFR